VSGEHDVGRALALARHFEIPAAVCVNRWDLCPELTERIEASAGEHGAEIAGRIRYDPSVTAAQVERRTVVEFGGPAADDMHRLWRHVSAWMTAGPRGVDV
jgi:MinD superfamily P-loop ATPase